MQRHSHSVTTRSIASSPVEYKPSCQPWTGPMVARIHRGRHGSSSAITDVVRKMEPTEMVSTSRGRSYTTVSTSIIELFILKKHGRNPTWCNFIFALFLSVGFFSIASRTRRIIYLKKHWIHLLSLKLDQFKIMITTLLFLHFQREAYKFDFIPTHFLFDSKKFIQFLFSLTST